MTVWHRGGVRVRSGWFAAAALSLSLACAGCAAGSAGSAGGSSASGSSSTITNPAATAAAAVALGRNWRTAVADAKALPANMQGFTSDYAVMNDSLTALTMEQLSAMCPAIRGGAQTYDQYKEGAGADALTRSDYDRLMTAICAASEPAEMTYVWKTVG